MTNFLESLPLRPRYSNSQSLFLLLVVAFLGVFVAQFIATLTALPLLEFSLPTLMEVLQDPSVHPRGQLAMLLMQSISSLLGFGIFPLLYLGTWEKQRARDISPSWSFRWQDGVFMVGILYTFLVVDAYIIEWNAGWKLPGGLETWARNLEEQASSMTTLLTKMEGPTDFLAILVVIAVIPALVEEFLFRGLIQNYLLRWTRNPHISIWVAAILFSAIHLQFYGFVPRMLLGALFGYLFFWSGRFWVPVVAHFLNNGVSLLFSYLAQREVIEDNSDTPEMLPLSATIGAFLFFVVLMWAYHNYTQKHPASPSKLE